MTLRFVSGFFMCGGIVNSRVVSSFFICVVCGGGSLRSRGRGASPRGRGSFKGACCSFRGWCAAFLRVSSRLLPARCMVFFYRELTCVVAVYCCGWREGGRYIDHHDS